MAKIKRICEQCGKEFESYPSNHRKFCSLKCHTKYKTGRQRIKRITKHCLNCGKKFKVIPSRFERLKYCSNVCSSEYKSKNQIGEGNPCWRAGKLECICKYCGEKFEIPKAWLKKGNGQYCSLSCKRKPQKIPKHHTKPELIFEEICKKNNLPFKYTGDSSFWIENINPDFIECNSKKIAVEIFGDYWHSPLLKQNIPYNQTYEPRKKLLKKYAWELIVFWGSDLLRKDAERFVLNKLEKEEYNGSCLVKC